MAGPESQQGYIIHRHICQLHAIFQCCLSNSAAQHCNLVLVGNQGPNETKLPLTLSILREDASENGATSKPWRLVEGAMGLPWWFIAQMFEIS